MTSPHATRLFLLFALLLAGCAPSLRAQAASATGTLEGRVQNVRTGEYLEGARLTVEGTGLEAFTDATGQYRLGGVPAGTARLRVFYTGLAPLVDTVTIAAGTVTTRDLNLTAAGVAPAAASAGTSPGETVKLAAFVVGESREMAASALAINEQRFAPNIKNILSTDEFGFVPEGNAAEFIKFLPGITIESTGGNSRDISINGAPSANVPITLDGFSVASAGVEANTGRAVAMDMLSVNNLARIEVEYSPTPESQGMALSGSINLVPRSAFERARPQLAFNTYLILRPNEYSFDKTPGPRASPSRKVSPGLDFTWIVPVNKKFGFTLSGGTSTNFSPEPLTQMLWRGASAATGGNYPATTPDAPYLTTYVYRDATKVTHRSSLAATLDYRLTPRDRLSLGFQYSYFNLFASNQTLSFVINQVPAGGFTPTSTQSAPGGGQLDLSNLIRDRYNRTWMPSLLWRHNGPIWKGDLGLSLSQSANQNRDVDKGAFNTTTGIRRNVTIAFNGIDAVRPRAITVTDGATGAPIDPFAIAGKSITGAASTQNDTADTQRTAYGNVSRTFSWGVPVTLKTGFRVQQSIRDLRGVTSGYTFTGADASAAPLLDPVYAARDGVYGFPSIQGISNALAYRDFQANPAKYTLNLNNQYVSFVTSSRRSEELISAGYVRGDVSFFERRLKLTGGLRAEQTNVQGEGPLSDPTRNFQRDAAGRVVTVASPTPADPNRRVPALIFPANNFLEVSRLTRIERGQRAEKEYLRLFPSLNASCSLRENLIARASWSTSIGRPNFGQYINGLNLPDTEALPSQGNVISVNNPGIKAWSAQTTNVRLEYYFAGVGQLSLNAFRRDTQDFFGATRFPATPEFLAFYALDPVIYGPYDIVTNYNVPGTVRVEGTSLNYKQALTFLPAWARGVQVFANVSAQRRTGALVGDSGYNFFRRSGSWGASLTRERWNARLNWNYRDQRRGAPVTGASIGADTYNWVPRRLTLDAQAEYNFYRTLSVFANVRNLTNETEDNEIYGPATPGFARFRNQIDYGAFWTFGVKGTF
jgi:TonB-dependent receptor